jgi:hypothetical protein
VALHRSNRKGKESPILIINRLPRMVLHHRLNTRQCNAHDCLFWCRLLCLARHLEGEICFRYCSKQGRDTGIKPYILWIQQGQNSELLLSFCLFVYLYFWYCFDAVFLSVSLVHCSTALYINIWIYFSDTALLPWVLNWWHH